VGSCWSSGDRQLIGGAGVTVVVCWVPGLSVRCGCEWHGRGEPRTTWLALSGGRRRSRPDCCGWPPLGDPGHATGSR
jgi:hypothetical protein